MRPFYRQIFRHTVFIALLLHASTGFTQTDYERGWDAFQNGLYETARSIWLPLARQNDGDAALGLAIIYENGLATRKDLVESARWYEIAAEQNIAEAQHDLGIKYFTGSGVKRNLPKTYQLWKKAAESGLSAAQTKFAFLHVQGMGTQQDFDTALKWYRQAAKQGNTEAMYNIGLMYQKGTGVPKNQLQYVHWLTEASNLDYPRAQYDLGLMKLHGKDVDRSVAQGKQLLLKAANNGSVDAQYYLGTLYLNGHILRPDKDLAVKLLESASRQGHKAAKQALVDLDNLEKGSDDTLVLGKISRSPSREKPASSQASAKSSIAPSSASQNIVVLNQNLVKEQSTADIPALPTSPSSSIDRTDWLVSQDKGLYTIQLMATTDKAGAEKYRAKLPASIDPFIYRFKRGNDTWYAIAAGIHNDYQLAKQAIKEFPGNIRKNKPWVRNLGKLQPILETQ